MAFSALLLVSACAERALPLPDPGRGGAGSSMDVLCYTGTSSPSSPAASKSLISSTSALTLDANFVRIDDSQPYDAAGSVYPGLSEAGIVEASVHAPSVMGGGQWLRGTSFTPNQHYDYEIENEDSEHPDTLFNKVRMVGWYPRTCVLPREENGQASSTAKFSDFGESFYSEGATTGITFRGRLDGQTDIMVSDMKEGMHISDAFRNRESGAVPPFGYRESPPGYSNYFTFRHYLSAVRIYISCDDIDLSLLSWGEVRNVVFPDQPTTVTVSLPEEPDAFGEVVEGSWADFKDMEIITTPIDDSSAETVDFPVSLVDGINGGIDGEIYLGYLLVRPGVDTKFEIHTDAGIFSLEIPVSYTDGSDGMERTLLEAGKIYNINVEVNTDGELAVFIKNDDDKKFRDLSPWNIGQGRFETANCYLINTAEDVDPSSGDRLYDGYFFNAMQAGNGDRGMLDIANRELYPDGSAELSPVSASILFQTQANTVRNVELIDGHVRFELNEQCYDSADPLQANAVIAVHDANGDVLWSWLIWVTREARDVTYDDAHSEPFTLLNMNLGANTALPGDNPLATYGVYYQWGRKDPSPRPPEADFSMKSMQTIEFYGPNGEPVNYVSEFSSDENTIEDSARNPLLLMDQNVQGPEYAFDWLYYEIDQLWGESVKTIYDPCPYGYKVPGDELETLFRYATSGYDRYNISAYGVSIGGSGLDEEIYFPFAGWKGYEAGVPDKGHPWQNVGVVGDYHDARIRMEDGHRTSNRIEAQNGLKYTAGSANRTSAAPVRCVRYAGEP